MMGGCVRIPPMRMLPNNFNSIYIITFENRSYEPGLEEKLTRATQEEFLVDGRLDVVGRRNADAVLVGKLLKFDVRADRFAADDFPLTSRITAVVDVYLCDPQDIKKEKPLMAWLGIDVEYSFVSDARRVIEVIPDDAYEDALRMLARRIVMTVITRPPQKRAATLVTEGAPSPTSPRRVLGREKVDTRFLEPVTSEPLTIKETEPAPGKGSKRKYVQP
jgi:hypothetical protein